MKPCKLSSGILISQHQMSNPFCQVFFGEIRLKCLLALHLAHMRFTVEGFNQRVLTEQFGLNHGDALIIRWCVDFYFSGRMIIWKNPEDEKDYFYINYHAIIEDWPCLEITNPEVIRRRFKKYVDAGLMEFCIRNKGGRYPYYRFTSKYYDLISEPTEPKTLITKRIPQAIDPPEEEHNIHSTEKSSEATEKSSEATEKSSEATEKSSWPTQKSRHRSINYNPSIRSINYNSSSTSSTNIPEEQKTADADDADAINSLFFQAGRKERVTHDILDVICLLHQTTANEVLKAAKAVIEQAKENYRTGGEPIRNIIGILKGRKNGDGHYHSYCFASGKCILAEPEEPQPKHSEPEPQQEDIDWQARFKALSSDKQAAYYTFAAQHIASHKANMSASVYQETLEYAALRAFIAAHQEVSSWR